MRCVISYLALGFSKLVLKGTLEIIGRNLRVFHFMPVTMILWLYRSVSFVQKLEVMVLEMKRQDAHNLKLTRFQMRPSVLTMNVYYVSYLKVDLNIFTTMCICIWIHLYTNVEKADMAKC